MLKILIDSVSNMRLRQEKKFPYPVFRFEFLYSSTWKICSRKSAEHLAVTKSREEQISIVTICTLPRRGEELSISHCHQHPFHPILTIMCLC